MNCDSQFRNNLEMLKLYDPALVEALGHTDTLFQLTQQYTYGPYQFDFTQPIDSRSDHYPFDPRLQTQANRQYQAIEDYLQAEVRFLILSGLGIGHVFANLETMFSKHPHCAVLICEPNVQRWAVALRLFSLDFLVHKPNLYLFAGPNATENAIEFVDQNYLYLLAGHQVKYLLGTLLSDSDDTTAYIQLAKEIAQSTNSLNQEFESALDTFHKTIAIQSASLRTAWLSVNSHAYIHYPIAQALLDGFATHGLETRLEPYNDPFSSPMRITGQFIENPPDLILSVNAFPSMLLEDLGLNRDTVKSIQRPKVCWMVDNTSHYETLKSTDLIADDWVFCIDRTFLPWLQSFTRNAHFLPVATTFQHAGEVRDELKAPISYVGSLPDLFKYFHNFTHEQIELLEIMEQCRSNDYTQSFYTHWLQQQPSVNHQKTLEEQANLFVANTKKQLSTQEAIVEYFLYNAATFFKRKRTVEALLPLGLVVYGPKSWLQALPDSYHDRYRGFMPGESLADCYASSQINLNIHSHQCPTCLNPRDVDVPMAGGLVLCDWVEDLDQGYLQEDKEIMVYRRVENLLETATSLLNDPSKIESVRQAGQQKVQSEHTYAHRAASILKILGDS